MEKLGKKSLGTIKTLQAHEAGPPASPRSQLEALQAGKIPEEIFLEQDPKKRELYALLGMVIADVWQEVQANLKDPATQKRRAIFDETGTKTLIASRSQVEAYMEKAFSLVGPCRALFAHYRELFILTLQKQYTEVQAAPEISQRKRVYQRLEALMGEGVHAVSSARTITDEVMAGLGTSGQVMTFVAFSIPDVFRDQYGHAPTRDEWLMIARNSEKFVLTAASKNLSKFVQMGHIFRRDTRSVKTTNGGIWNEQLFRIEGEGDERFLGVQEGPLASLLTVRDMEETSVKKAERVGCPALYVDAIAPLYRAFLRDLEVYVAPHYDRLTAKKGYYD